jgi:hypothetical protein
MTPVELGQLVESLNIHFAVRDFSYDFASGNWTVYFKDKQEFYVLHTTFYLVKLENHIVVWEAQKSDIRDAAKAANVSFNGYILDAVFSTIDKIKHRQN